MCHRSLHGRVASAAVVHRRPGTRHASGTEVFTGADVISVLRPASECPDGLEDPQLYRGLATQPRSIFRF